MLNSASSKIKENLLYNLFISVLNGVFPLITLPYLTKVINPTSFGELIYWQSIGLIIGTILLLGIPIYGVKELAKRKSPEDQKIFIEQIISLKIIIAIVLIIISFYLFIDKEESKFEFLTLFLILSTIFSFEWAVQGLRGFKKLAIRNLILKSITLGLLLAFVKEEDDGIIYYSILVLINCLLSLTNFWLVRKQIERKLNFKIRIDKTHLKPLLILSFSIIATMIYTLFDNILLEKLSDHNSLAIYNIGQRIVKSSLLLISSISTVFIASLSYFYSRDIKSYHRTIEKSFEIVFLVGIPLFFLFLSLSPLILDLLVSSEYKEAYTVLKILSPLPLIVGLSNIFGLQVISIQNKDQWLLQAYGTAAIVSILMNIILIPLFGYVGAAITYLASETTVLIICIYQSTKIMNVRSILGKNLSDNFLYVTIFASLLAIIDLLEFNYLTKNLLLLGTLVLVFLLFNFRKLKVLIKNTF